MAAVREILAHVLRTVMNSGGVISVRILVLTVLVVVSKLMVSVSLTVCEVSGEMIVTLHVL